MLGPGRRIRIGRGTIRTIAVGGLAAAAITISAASSTLFSGRNTASTVAHHEATAEPTTTSVAPDTTTTEPPTTTTAPPPTTTTAPAPAPSQVPPPTQAPAPPPPTAPPVPPPSGGNFCTGGAGGLGVQVIADMNADRAANGIGALCANAQLTSLAQNWANWMAANHSLTHQNLAAIIGGTSFTTMGENLLSGPSSMSASAMEAAWMGSAEHRANILRSAFSCAGVGSAVDATGTIWVAVDFGG